MTAFEKDYNLYSTSSHAMTLKVLSWSQLSGDINLPREKSQETHVAYVRALQDVLSSYSGRELKNGRKPTH